MIVALTTLVQRLTTLVLTLNTRVTNLESEILDMTQVDIDLQAAQDAMTKAVTDAAAELKLLSDEVKAMGTAPAVDAAKAEATAQSIMTLATNLEAAVAASQPAPAPAPAPAPVPPTA